MIAIAALFLSALAIALIGALATHAHRLDAQLRALREDVAAQRAFGPSPWMSPAPDWLRPRSQEEPAGVGADSRVADAIFPVASFRVAGLPDAASGTWPLDPALRPSPAEPNVDSWTQGPPHKQDAAEPALWPPSPLTASFPSALGAGGGAAGMDAASTPPWAKLAGGVGVIALLLALALVLPSLSQPLMLTVTSLGVIGALASAPSAQDHARVRQIGLAVSAAAGATLLAATALFGPVSMAGGGLAALIVVAACVGAAKGRLEPMLIAAWFATCAGVWILSGERAGDIWLTPVAAILGAVFLAVAAAQPHRLSPKGVVLSAISAIAPLWAVAVLSGEGQPLADEPLAAAGAYVGVSVLLAAVAVAAAKAQGGLAAMGLSAWALLGGASVGAVSALLLAAPPLFAPVALALGATAAAWRARVRAHAFFAAAAGVASLLALGLSLGLALNPDIEADHAGFATFAAGLVLASTSALPPPRLKGFLEAPAIAALVLAMTVALMPQVFAGQLASFAVLCGFAAAMLGSGLALRLAAARANGEARTVLAWALVGAGSFALLLAVGYPQNPWWGAQSATVGAAGVLAGTAGPALLLAVHGTVSRRRGQYWGGVAFGLLAGLIGMSGAAMLIRLAFHGGAWGAGLAHGELLISSLAVLLVGTTLMAFGWRRAPESAIRWTGVALVMAAVLKLVGVDAVMAGWLPAFAAAALCLLALGVVIIQREALVRFLRQG